MTVKIDPKFKEQFDRYVHQKWAAIIKVMSTLPHPLARLTQSELVLSGQPVRISTTLPPEEIRKNQLKNIFLLLISAYRLREFTKQNSEFSEVQSPVHKILQDVNLMSRQFVESAEQTPFVQIKEFDKRYRDIDIKISENADLFSKVLYKEFRENLNNLYLSIGNIEIENERIKIAEDHVIQITRIASQLMTLANLSDSPIIRSMGGELDRHFEDALTLATTTKKEVIEKGRSTIEFIAQVNTMIETLIPLLNIQLSMYQSSEFGTQSEITKLKEDVARISQGTRNCLLQLTEFEEKYSPLELVDIDTASNSPRLNGRQRQITEGMITEFQQVIPLLQNLAPSQSEDLTETVAKNIDLNLSTVNQLENLKEKLPPENHEKLDSIMDNLIQNLGNLDGEESDFSIAEEMKMESSNHQQDFAAATASVASSSAIASDVATRILTPDIEIESRASSAHSMPQASETSESTSPEHSDLDSPEVSIPVEQHSPSEEVVGASDASAAAQIIDPQEQKRLNQIEEIKSFIDYISRTKTLSSVVLENLSAKLDQLKDEVMISSLLSIVKSKFNRDLTPDQLLCEARKGILEDLNINYYEDDKFKLERGYIKIIFNIKSEIALCDDVSAILKILQPDSTPNSILTQEEASAMTREATIKKAELEDKKIVAEANLASLPEIAILRAITAHLGEDGQKLWLYITKDFNITTCQPGPTPNSYKLTLLKAYEGVNKDWSKYSVRAKANKEVNITLSTKDGHPKIEFGKEQIRILGDYRVSIEKSIKGILFLPNNRLKVDVDVPIILRSFSEKITNYSQDFILNFFAGTNWV